MATPVTWHAFAPTTFHIDRTCLRLDEQISIYGPARCILDAFRLRHQEGSGLALDTLRRWLNRPGTQPTTLLEIARHSPTPNQACRQPWRSCSAEKCGPRGGHPANRDRRRM